VPSEHGQAAAPFVFYTCQVGAEPALKRELQMLEPSARLAFSRPGFLTFKLPEDRAAAHLAGPVPVFARSRGASLGRAEGTAGFEVAQSAWNVLAGHELDRLHVWPRDAVAAGDHGYEPGPTAASQAAAAALADVLAAHRRGLPTGTAVPGERVLDCVVVEPREWWLGTHRARDPVSCWPGGVYPAELPAGAVSRAYLKMVEAWAWSELPARAGDRWAEIGCAPGGSCQALLDRGMYVLGIDPAEVDPRVLAHPRFTHLRRRGSEVRRREFRDVQWLAADLNVAPRYALDTLEGIVTHGGVRVRGLLLTLKLLDWKLAEELPQWLARIQGWGFTAQARQLGHHRQELCVAALRRGAGPAT
jgi:23S rRNA (cytidine2498-2'-O)-methyltransferase